MDLELKGAAIPMAAIFATAPTISMEEADKKAQWYGDLYHDAEDGHFYQFDGKGNWEKLFKKHP